MEVNKTVELKTTAKAIEFSANKPTSVSSEFSSNTLTVNYFEQGKKKSTEIVLESSALVSFIFNPTTNNFDLGTDEPESDYSYIPIGYAYVSDGAITKFIPFGAVDYSSEIDEEKTARESADELLQAKKVDKVTGKGLSTNDYTTAEKTKLYGIEPGAEANVQSDWSQSDSSADDYIKNKPANLVQDSSYVHTDNNFNNDYKSKIETNEYNDVFNIRVEWDREYMPHVELIRIYFQYYESGRLAEDAASYPVTDIANGNVYLYKNTSDQWQIAVGTPPSSYHRLPMLVGKIATKTVNGESVKLFFRNGDDETQFDKLNSVKVDKETWELIDTVTIEEEVSQIYKNVDSDGNALKLKAIKILASLGSSSTSTAELIIIACSDNNYSSTVGLCTERLALPGAKINYVAKQQNGYWNAEWSGRKATTNYKGGYFLEPAFSTLSVTSKPYIQSWKVRTPTSNVTFSTSTKIEIWGIRG